MLAFMQYPARMLFVASGHANGSFLDIAGWPMIATWSRSGSTSFGRRDLSRKKDRCRLHVVFDLHALHCIVYLLRSVGSEAPCLDSHVGQIANLQNQSSAEFLLRRRGLCANHVLCSRCARSYEIFLHLRDTSLEHELMPNLSLQLWAKAAGCHAATAGKTALKRFLATAAREWLTRVV